MIRKITWGDTVRISDDAPSEFRPGARAAVCGFREIDKGVNDTEAPRLVLVEFSEGNAIEIPETFLIRDTGGTSI
jgi:hypothetical protein